MRSHPKTCDALVSEIAEFLDGAGDEPSAATTAMIMMMIVPRRRFLQCEGPAVEAGEDPPDEAREPGTGAVPAGQGSAEVAG
jgi:hypothetical protein